MNDVFHYLKQHLNVYWLRPESALWDAIASYEINHLNIQGIDVDLGSGNGIFSFITAGGQFSELFDWFVQSNITEKDKNVFEYCDPKRFRKEFVTKKPDIPYRVAFDRSPAMLEQAKTLNWYEEYVQGDIAEKYPFEGDSLTMVFSNIIYWTPDPVPAMKELRRVLKRGGQIIICLPDPRFVDFCPSYKSHLEPFRWLKKLNRDRASCIARYYGIDDILLLAKKHDFDVVYHKEYLSKELLLFWDIGFRPLIRPLLKTVSYLNEAERREVKMDWVEQLLDDLAPIVEREIALDAPKGFHLCVLEKK
jgi:SAM-dependent methyltransferase